MIHVVADIVVKPGHRDEFVSLFQQLVPTVLAEVGCLAYVPTVEVETGIGVQLPVRPHVVTVIEQWESVDTLRANLFMSMDTKNTRSIAVASSMSGEGKSSVASQLALSIAKATGETVLLVDCDLRCPDQHDIFGLEMGAGLASVLAEEATLDQVIDTSLGDLIHVVTSGRLKCSPHRLICPAAMQNFVNKALESYRFVVLDTAPVLSAGETLAVEASASAGNDDEVKVGVERAPA